MRKTLGRSADGTGSCLSDEVCVSTTVYVPHPAAYI